MAGFTAQIAAAVFFFMLLVPGRFAHAAKRLTLNAGPVPDRARMATGRRDRWAMPVADRGHRTAWRHADPSRWLRPSA